MSAKKTLIEKFFEQAAIKQEATAFFYCRPQDSRWVTMSWNRYREDVTTFAAWLQANGVKKGTKLGILSPNRPEWIISDLAIQSLGAITVPIYPSASSSESAYILEHSEAEWLITDSLDRIKYLAAVPLKGIVSFNKPDNTLASSFVAPAHSFASIVVEGAPALKSPTPVTHDDIATIIYTSGTTGRPKGVVHTHGTIAEAMITSSLILDNKAAGTDRFFSFLPLSHVAERVLVEIGSICIGAEVSFARSVDTIGEDLPRCQPTILLCVPRLWEKVYEGIIAKVSKGSSLKQSVFKFAGLMGSSRVEGTRVNAATQAGVFPHLADALVGKKLRDQLGMSRVRMFLTGAAPTRPEIHKFFASYGMIIREVYGLTENLCCGVLNNDDEILVDSCGKPFPGNEVRVAADGEIMFRAPWIFKGYYKNEEATKEVLSADGWFATGDLGKLDDKGRLYIVGRKKELLKTSTGKYVAPVPIEDSIKGHPMIKEVMMVGDSRKYCVALVTIESDVPAEQYHEELKKWIIKVNEPLANFEAVKRIGILKEGFTIENGSLTPTLKLKRSAVAKNKEAFIDRVYNSEEFVVLEA